MIERKGNCWESAFNGLINPPVGRANFTPMLVHGLPTGTMGAAGEAGVYCHAWIEYPDWLLVYDTEVKMMVPKVAYYKVGKIEYTKSYTRHEALEMINEHGTFGPWDEKILDRDAEIDQISERGGLRTVSD